MAESPIVGVKVERIGIAGSVIPGGVNVVLQFRADGTVTWKELDTP